MDRDLRVAVIGVGHMGRHHARIYGELDGCELVAVVDKDIDRAKEIAAKHGGTAYASVSDIPGKLDAATIAVPTVVHQEVAIPLMERGVAVLIEKPLAPDSASAMELRLSAPDGKESKASIERIYDPTGARLRRRENRLDTAKRRREVEWSVTDKLIPGVWELPVVADRPDKEWPFDLAVRFFGLHAEPQQVAEWSGSPPEGEITITNVFERALHACGEGLFEGFRKHKEDKFEGLTDTLTYAVTLDERFDRVRIDLEMTPEAYATTTDIGVSLEADGEEIYSSAFSNRIKKATVDVPDVGEKTEVKLIIRGGFAVTDDKRETPITVKIDQLLEEPVPLEVTHGEAAEINFVPGVPITLDFALESRLPDTPEGLRPVGYLHIRERSSNDIALRVPIDIGV